jgi:hypothetical protein
VGENPTLFFVKGKSMIAKGYCDIAIAVQTGVELPPQVTAVEWRKVAHHKEGLLLMGRVPWLGCGDEIEEWAESSFKWKDGSDETLRKIRYLRIEGRPGNSQLAKSNSHGYWNDPFGLHHCWGQNAQQLAHWWADKPRSKFSCGIALAIKRSVDLPTELRVRDWPQQEENAEGFLFLDHTDSYSDWEQIQNWLDRRSHDPIIYTDGLEQPPEDSYRYVRVGPFIPDTRPRSKGCTFGTWQDSFGLWKCPVDDFSSISSWFGK